jgi:RNA polymerase subunit RPABC4/transcription elongation factor Spt4
MRTVTPDPPLVVARWATHRTHSHSIRCSGCGWILEPGTLQCPQCREAASPEPTGMLAVVVVTGVGRRIVVAERTPSGGWAPTRSVPATGETVRVLRRQDCTDGNRPGGASQGRVVMSGGELW